MFCIVVFAPGPAGERFDFRHYRQCAAQVIPQLQDRVELVFVIEGAGTTLLRAGVINVLVMKVFAHDRHARRQIEDVEIRMR